MFRGKQVLVAGGTGLIGIPLVEMLVAQGAKVRIASLDDRSRAILLLSSCGLICAH